MDYSTASSIRGQKLSSLITGRIMSGQGVGSSIKGALSDRMKAKAMGVKERYDPLNIAKKLTGGGSLAPALLGRMMGRSKEDISYFAGKGTATALGKETGNIGGGSVDVLNRILAFLQKSHEIDVRTMEVKKNFQEEAMNEDEKRHQQFLKVLKSFTASSGTATPVGGKTGGSSFLDMLMSMLDGIPWLSTIKKMIPFFGRLVTFFTGPVGMAILGFVALNEFAAWMNSLFSLKKDEANEMLKRNNPAELKNEGGEAYVKRIAGQITPEYAKELLVSGTQKDILMAGGKKELMRIAGMTEEQVKAAKSETGGSQTAKQISSSAAGVGGAAASSPTASPVGSESSSGGSGSSMSPSGSSSGDSSGTPPMTPMPTSSGVSETTNQNIDLNMEQSTASGGGSSGPIVTNTTNNMGNEKSAASTTASQRDNTPVLVHIYNALDRAGFL